MNLERDKRAKGKVIFLINSSVLKKHSGTRGMTRKFQTTVFPRVYLNPYPYRTSLPSTLCAPGSLGHSVKSTYEKEECFPMSLSRGHQPAHPSEET